VLHQVDKINIAANMILESMRIVVFTGAGISTESGIAKLF
jgi:NAD-dependent SIR2 family protein deacetylase